MNPKEILNTAYDRGAHRLEMYHAMMKDISALEGAKQELSQERIVSTSDTQQRMLELIEQFNTHAEGHINAIKDGFDAVRQAEMLIGSIKNPRWQQALTCRYIGQMGWKEVAEQLHTTDDAVKAMCARAIENLEAREDLNRHETTP